MTELACMPGSIDLDVIRNCTSFAVINPEALNNRPRFNIVRDEPQPKKRVRPPTIKFPRIKKWNLEIFLERANIVHGERYDYSQIKEEHITSQMSKVPISCFQCGYRWNPDIGNHIHGTGCPECAGKVKWTAERFITKSKAIHGDKFNYELITSKHVESGQSNVPLICNICNHRWSPTIASHISGTGCPKCSGHVQWTWSQFLKEANEIHQHKYAYIGIDENTACASRSRVEIFCKTCKRQWDTTISHHIYDSAGCSRCAGNEKWTLENFVAAATKIHGIAYNYDLVKDEHIENNNSKIPVYCNTCKNTWYPSISHHINGGTRCPRCVFRGHSKAQIRWLESVMEEDGILIQHALSPEGEYRIPGVGRVDGYCKETKTCYEFMGVWWHGHPKYFHPDDIHPMNKIPYGVLYQRTLDRNKKIEDLGYTLVVKWEKD